MAENRHKQTKKGQELKSHWASIRFEIVCFVIWRSIVSLFKNIVFILVPAADRRAGGGFSRIVRTIFAIISLEGPRLMLISRHRAAQMERGTKVGLSAVSGTAIAAIVMATIIVSSQLMAVTVDGKIVGYVENEEQYASLLQRAKAKISEQVGTENTEILIQDTNVSLEPVIAPQQQAMTVASEPAAETEEGVTEDGAQTANPDADNGQGTDPGFPGGPADPADPAAEEEALLDSLIGTLLDGSAIKANVYTITINDQVMATLGSMKEASEVLNKVADTYIPSEGEYVGKFLDDVQIKGVTIMLDSVKVQNPDEVVAFLLSGVSQDRYYTAEENDSIENIYGTLGITKDELLELYSGYDFNNIGPGDVFGATLALPYLRYETVSIESTIEDMPYPTIEENTNTLYLGQRKVKDEGVVGEREVTRTVTKINGRVSSSVEINSVTIKEPVPEVVYVGTMMIASYDAYVGPSDGFGGGGNGPLGRPLNEWYLSRSVSAGHSGADMIAPRGAPIFSAGYGTVTFAGVYGGYGNFIIVDHGNGLQTYYAHCDTLNVGAGTVVQRGQQIATVGSTGRSTAFHLHFEVRVNGVVQEPMNWIG